MERHDLALLAVYYDLCKHYGFEVTPRWWELQTLPVRENHRAKILWDVPIPTAGDIVAWPGQENWNRSLGTEVLFVAARDYLPSHPTKDRRATDSCFSLIEAHQCGVLIVDAEWSAASKSAPSEALVVSIETGRGWQSRRDWAITWGGFRSSRSSGIDHQLSTMLLGLPLNQVHRL